MAYEMKDGQGSMFLETEKKSDKAPDFAGKFKVAGTEFRIVGWKRESKGGKAYISLAVEEMDEHRRRNEQRRSNSGGERSYGGRSNNDIPF
jgi:hypothetical protein